ncbi:hypothetical protein A2961_01100 [Candidatus Woesebacteria bacterium RIFCSPLOWO2_01_FULL_39_21]|uniref:Methyltransferase type 11 domain-containing protein n=1 Tax=Candidatus Woesebacteria bacterium RIFCSPLOWO2_01_FULL_39_21 TaxID=1802519 RepID=A0A1F8BHK8_9BACT|nr:MAG: hypothetical protein A2691_00170 [Candidatus Woesebacteria bacterium RIFCSPHIGHO2_01_FULL_39_23]OGM63546.1 MAG: hypothetical protein A2961_01100 [Candidatus Woesebacteria bacterium RIFCSPLOWO2_01_FULL_39_21]
MINTKTLEDLLSNTGDMCLKRRAREIVVSLSPQKNETVLDAGCGDGFYLHLLSKLCSARLVGLDDNPKALDLAKSYVKSKKLKLVEGSVMNMPFEDDIFDKIICSEVLEHLPDDVGGLREFKRVLKKGGVLTITVPSHNYPFLWDPVSFILEKVFGTHIKDGFWAGVWNQHIRLYTPEGLIQTVKKSGLKVEEVKVLTHYGLPFNHFLLNLGYRIRKSKTLPGSVTKSLSKFSSDNGGNRDLYHLFLKAVNFIDRLNDREFNLDTSTVGISLVAIKQRA